MTDDHSAPQRPDGHGDGGRDGSPEGAVLLFLMVLALLVSPMLLLWSAPGRPWWLLFALWAGVIATTAWVHRRTDRRS